MKALYTPAPGEYGLIDRPMPTCAPDQALVRVTHAGLCHTDVDIRAGTAGHVRYPVIPGHEFAGIVESIGPAVHHVAVGERVVVHHIQACNQCTRCRRGDSQGCENQRELGATLDGGFAEYCVVTARHLYRLPEHLSLAEGALTEPVANAVSAVGLGRIRSGERVVVIGPGPIGLLVTQVARLAYPSQLVLVGTRDERLALGERCGATHTVNILRKGSRTVLKDILGGQGVDVVILCAGVPSAFDLALDILGWRGRIVSEATFPMDLVVPLQLYPLLNTHAGSLIGVNGWVTAEFVQAMDLMARGLVDVKPLITHSFPLAEWEKAFDMITQHKGEAIKVEFVF